MSAILNPVCRSTAKGQQQVSESQVSSLGSDVSSPTPEDSVLTSRVSSLTPDAAARQDAVDPSECGAEASAGTGRRASSSSGM